MNFAREIFVGWLLVFESICFERATRGRSYVSGVMGKCCKCFCGETFSRGVCQSRHMYEVMPSRILIGMKKDDACAYSVCKY